MNDKKTHQPPLSDRELGELLRTAGPRPAVPEADLRQIRSAAKGAWQQLVARQRKKTVLRRLGWAAAAMVAAVAVTLAIRPSLEPDRSVPPLGPAATVMATSGTSWISLELGSDQLPLLEGQTLRAGSWLETGRGDDGPSRVALALVSGATLRLDLDTRVRLHSDSVVELLRGAVYVDSDPALGGSDLEIRTALGEVHEIGTQFEVRLMPETDGDPSLRVRVREGAVLVEQTNRVLEASVGDEITVFPDGSSERNTVPLFGPAWSWILASAPPLEIEGVSAGSFLSWVTRETGWKLVLVPETLEETLDFVTLHGSIEGLTPDQAPSVVLPGCGLDHTVREGRLVVSRPPGTSGP